MPCCGVAHPVNAVNAEEFALGLLLPRAGRIFSAWKKPTSFVNCSECKRR